MIENMTQNGFPSLQLLFSDSLLACLFVRLHSYSNSYVASYASVAIRMKKNKNTAP
ncbi:MAG: hypothetical protein V3V31_01055 [Methylococcales bacterium]